MRERAATFAAVLVTATLAGLPSGLALAAGLALWHGGVRDVITQKKPALVRRPLLVCPQM